ATKCASPAAMSMPTTAQGKLLRNSSASSTVAMAQSGLRTIVVDSDMRRPRIHKAFGGRNGKGLSSILTDDMPLAEAALETDVENLEVLTCGPIPPNPSELLHTTRFQRLLEELDERYDRVIFDSPPLGAVSDGLVLSHSVDAVLLILKFGQTRRETLRRAIEQLVTVGAPFMGCVLNDIDASTGGYGYSYYYYRYNYDDRADSSDDMKSPDLDA
ncbi:MAG: CpsD/CapB family tyrosine-protein kinase, partial [Myxococcota bacterium]